MRQTNESANTRSISWETFIERVDECSAVLIDGQLTSRIVKPDENQIIFICNEGEGVEFQWTFFQDNNITLAVQDKNKIYAKEPYPESNEHTQDDDDRVSFSEIMLLIPMEVN